MQGRGRREVMDRFIRFCRLLEPLLTDECDLPKGHCVHELHDLSQHWWDSVDRIYIDAETNGGG